MGKRRKPPPRTSPPPPPPREDDPPPESHGPVPSLRRSLYWIAALTGAFLVGVLLWYKLFLTPDPPQDLNRPSALPRSGEVSPASSADDAGTASAEIGREGELQSTRIGLEDFLGAEACASCHGREYELWAGSTHGRAGGRPETANIIAPFDGTPLRFKDATVTPATNAAGDFLFVIERGGAGAPNGRMEIKVDAVVGGGHMAGGGTQSFFQTYADGTMRFLPFDYIREEGLWFVQLKKDNTWAPVSGEIALETDLANWPPHRVLGSLTEFSNCQNCHGSQISASYDVARRRFDTRFATLNIDCESCHGPGRRHVELAGRPGFEALEDIGMTPLGTLSKDASLAVCFQCHATKDFIREEPYLPGKDFESHFSVKLPLFMDDPFFPDGRVRRFGYQSNHQYSDCYLSGSMTCVDCHDPHAQTYRDVSGRPLAGRFDNGQCTGCHASKAEHPERHSRHAPGTAGNLCASCHMPYLQHPGVGDRLRFARSDHTIPIPRPDFDARLGVRNACAGCHEDRPANWVRDRVAEWHGELKPHHPMVANLLRGGEIADPAAAAALLLDPDAGHPMAQMAGLGLFIRRFVGRDPGIRGTAPVGGPSMADDATVAATRLMALAALDDMDLKSLALMALDVGYADRPGVGDVLEKAKGELEAGDGPVRNRWSIAADYLGGIRAAEGDDAGAMHCFRKAIEAKPDNVVALSHMALTLLRTGEVELALATLAHAARLRPEKAALHFQQAQVLAGLGRIPEAVQAVETGLGYAPWDERARRMLGALKGM